MNQEKSPQLFDPLLKTKLKITLLRRSPAKKLRDDDRKQIIVERKLHGWPRENDIKCWRTGMKKHFFILSSLKQIETEFLI